MKYILIIFILISILSCSVNKEPYIYEICISEPADTSIMIKNQLTESKDTGIYYFTGKVIDKKQDIPKEYANVYLKNLKTNEEFIESTDTYGQFSFKLYRGEYYLKVGYVGYDYFETTINLENYRNLGVVIALGRGNSLVTYEIKSDKKLNKRQLKNKAKELQN
jgi:hypothetical protein